MKIFKKENSYRKQIAIITTIFFLIFIVVLFIAIKWEGLCLENEIFKNCYWFGNNILGPTLSLSLSLFFSLLPFTFLNPQIYRTWRWFAVVAIPLIILIIATIPRNDYFGREAWTMFLSVSFLIITLLIIIYKSIRLKFSKKSEKIK